MVQYRQAAAFLSLLGVASASIADSSATGNLRNSMVTANHVRHKGVRKKKPPNRRLRKGLAYKNGVGGREQEIWIDGKQQQQEEAKPIISQTNEQQAGVDEDGDGKPQKDQPKDRTFGGRGWDRWDWGKDIDVANEDEERNDESWFWSRDEVVENSVEEQFFELDVQDRRGGYGDEIPYVTPREEVPLVATDRKGGGRQEWNNGFDYDNGIDLKGWEFVGGQQRRAGKKGGAKVSVAGRGGKKGGGSGGDGGGWDKGGGRGGFKRKGDGVGLKTGYGREFDSPRKGYRGKKGGKRQRRLKNENNRKRSGALMRDAEMARQVPSKLPEELKLSRETAPLLEDNSAAKAAKESLSGLDAFSLFSNQKWEHQFFRPLSSGNGKKKANPEDDGDVGRNGKDVNEEGDMDNNTADKANIFKNTLREASSATSTGSAASGAGSNAISQETDVSRETSAPAATDDHGGIDAGEPAGVVTESNNEQAVQSPVPQVPPNVSNVEPQTGEDNRVESAELSSGSNLGHEDTGNPTDTLSGIDGAAVQEENTAATGSTSISRPADVAFEQAADIALDQASSPTKEDDPPGQQETGANVEQSTAPTYSTSVNRPPEDAFEVAAEAALDQEEEAQESAEAGQQITAESKIPSVEPTSEPGQEVYEEGNDQQQENANFDDEENFVWDESRDFPSLEDMEPLPPRSPTEKSQSPAPVATPVAAAAPVQPTSPSPSQPPSKSPTPYPSKAPTPSPTKIPTASPTEVPTLYPSPTPSSHRTQMPSEWEDRSDCRICSSGHGATNPDRIIMHTKQSCEELAGQLDFSPGSSCGQIKADIPIDLESYCGCQGAPQFTSWCRFCPAGKTNIFHEVTIPSLKYMSCGDVEKYAAYVTEPESCQKLGHLANLCCGTLDEYWRGP